MTETLHMTRAARRWSRHLPAGRQLAEAGEQDAGAAIFAGAGAGEFTGLILGPPETGQAGPGEADHRPAGLRTGPRPGHRPLHHPADPARPPHPGSHGSRHDDRRRYRPGRQTYTSLPAAKKGCQKRSARPLEWAGHAGGISRAGSARHGHWMIFLSIVEA